MTGSIRTPDQRLRVFVSSTLDELAEERKAVRIAIEKLRMTPVMFELGARPHPPRDLYRAYLEQSDIFVGIYWESYGWQAPGETMSGIEDEFVNSSGRPRLLYVKQPAPERHERLENMLNGVRQDGGVSYKKFSTATELKNLLLDDLALLISERFTANSRSAKSLPVGTVTFFFSEIDQSKRLLNEAGSSYGEIVDRYNLLMESVIEASKGTEVRNDAGSFFAAFSSAVDAANAAAAAHLAMSGEPWPADATVRLRIGLHTGESRMAGGTYVGLDVHRASRLTAAAHGGQTLLTGRAAEMVLPFLSDGKTLTDLGLHNLPDIDRGERVFQLNAPNLLSHFPPIRSCPERRLPVPLSSFVGRDEELRSARELLLDKQVRLLTITGAGGIGKTRLAIELARLVETDFPGGVFFVDLSSVFDTALVLPALGRALGVLDAEGRELDRAIALFVGDAQMLVVLDNMEQVIITATDLAAILRSTTNLKFLVTSREPLRVSGEREFPLRPLPLPDDDVPVDALEAVPSMDLFIQRARAVVPDFEMSETNAPSLVELLNRLDGLPLAIELAAPKLRYLTPAALLDRLGAVFGGAGSASRDMPERHHNMRSAITWSFDLLSEEERVLFRRLGVFAGGWTLEAAHQIGGETELLDDSVLDLLTELVTKSMVSFYLDTNGQPRYRLLETLRQFASDKLAASGESERVQDAHLHWCLGLVRAHEASFFVSDFPAALNAIEDERHNIRLALHWAMSSATRIEAGLEIAGLLWSYWDVRGYVTEGILWLDQLLEGAGADLPTAARANALDARGWLGRLHPGSVTSEATFTEAEQLWRKVGDVRRLAWSISMHGMITFNAFDYDRAKEQFDEGTRLARDVGDEQLLEIWSTYGLAHVHWLQGEVGEARELLDRSLAFARKWRHTWAIGHAQFSLGLFELMMGDLIGARSRLVESLALRVEIRDLRGIADCLGSMAMLSAKQGDSLTATQLLGAAESQRQATGHVLVPWQRSFIDETIEHCRETLGTDIYTKVYIEGARLNRTQTIELAFTPAAPELLAGQETLPSRGLTASA